MLLHYWYWGNKKPYHRQMINAFLWMLLLLELVLEEELL